MVKATQLQMNFVDTGQPPSEAVAKPDGNGRANKLEFQDRPFHVCGKVTNRLCCFHHRSILE